MGNGSAEILHHCNAKIVERYNKYTHNLPSLQVGDTIAIQSPLNQRWNTMVKIITPLPDCQYQIRVDRAGRITLRNRRFLRKCELKPALTSIPSATPGPITSSNNTRLLHLYPPTSPFINLVVVVWPGSKWYKMSQPVSLSVQAR